MEFGDHFWLLFRFAGESYVANYIFSFTLLRRRKFYCRLAFSAGIVLCALLLMAGLLAVFSPEIPWLQEVCFGLILGPMCFAWLAVCFQDSAWNLVFCAVFGVMTKLGAVQLVEALRLAAAHSGIPTLFGEDSIAGICSQYAVILIVYASTYFIVGRHYERSDSFIRCGKRIVPLYFFTMLVISVITSVLANLPKEDVTSAMVLNVCVSIVCFLVIQVQFSLSREMISEGRTATMDVLLSESQKQFEALKESMEIINLKCHDLRHQLHALKNGPVNSSYLDELAEAINIYDSTIKTGNSVLDVILTDKSLRCAAGKIDFSCIAEGAKLSFMAESDINSLIGNAIENAMEYEAKIEDEEKRFVSLTIRAESSVLFVRVENYWCGEPLEWQAGLPVSTKEDDRRCHGFGMLSMRRIAEKYGGELQVKAEDDLFQVVAVIPLQ